MPYYEVSARAVEGGHGVEHVVVSEKGNCVSVVFDDRSEAEDFCFLLNSARKSRLVYEVLAEISHENQAVAGRC